MSNFPIEQAADINTHPDILRDLADESIELARVVAKNPSTPPDVLKALSGYEDDPEVQRNVTANPNTPVEELIALGADFPILHLLCSGTLGIFIDSRRQWRPT